MTLELKCTYQQVKKAIKEHGAFFYTVSAALDITESTLYRYLEYWPDLRQQIKKGKKRAANRIEEKILAALSNMTLEDIKTNAVLQKYALTLLRNVKPKSWGITTPKPSVMNTVNSVNIVNNNEPPKLSNERIQAIVSNVRNKSRKEQAEILNALENGLKELPPEETVLDNVPPALPYNEGMEHGNGIHPDNPTGPGPDVKPTDPGNSNP